MNKLKVIQLLPELNIGGVERGTRDFSRALIKKGHESIVISNGGIFEKQIIDDGGRHIKLPIHKKNIFSLKLSKALREIYISERPDIIHVRSRMPAWISYFAIKKMNNKPIYISTFHGLYSTPIYSQIMTKVDHIIAISQTVKDYIKSTYKVSDKNITTIPRGCDVSTFNKQPVNEKWLKEWYEEFPHTKNKILLTMPSRISQWKGLDCFIEAIKLLNNDKYHALIVGPTSTNKKKYSNTLKTYISKNNLENKITFTGSRNDIANIYKISEIVFNLSIKPEPFGRTTIEAISCGTKVMGWNHGGTKEILENLFPDGLVELNNIHQLTMKIEQIANNKNFAPLENTFTAEKMIEETVNLYHQLLKSRS